MTDLLAGETVPPLAWKYSVNVLGSYLTRMVWAVLVAWSWVVRALPLKLYHRMAPLLVTNW